MLTTVVHLPGSSPLARGLLISYWDEYYWTGIIPARAGFTPVRCVRRACVRDHPRSRGVYPGVEPVSAATWGSSPLARGLLWKLELSFPDWRIIPARAGFTGTKARPGERRPDHPRSRGVYARARLTATEFDGSSPLARGLRLGRRKGLPRGRIIPARAGFTQSRPSRRRGRSDHPRSRGVYVRRRTKVPRTSGSSPLARGLR